MDSPHGSRRCFEGAFQYQHSLWGKQMAGEAAFQNGQYFFLGDSIRWIQKNNIKPLVRRTTVSLEPGENVFAIDRVYIFFKLECFPVFVQNSAMRGRFFNGNHLCSTSA